MNDELIEKGKINKDTLNSILSNIKGLNFYFVMLIKDGQDSYMRMCTYRNKDEIREILKEKGFKSMLYNISMGE
jgi:hypothetical protein